MDLINILKKEFGDNRIREGEEISGKIAAKIGGTAAIYFEATTQEELIKILKIVSDQNAKFVLIGAGTNTIISDEGYSGLVIKNNTRKFEILSMRGKIKNNKIDVDKAFLYAESGCFLNQIIRYSLENGMGGLEELLGTPGSIGGFLKKSILKNDQNSALESLYQLRLIDRKGQIKFIDPKKTDARDFNNLMEKDDVILTATFLLNPQDEKMLWDRATDRSKEKEAIFEKGKPLGILFKNISLADAMRAPTPGHITSAEDLIQKSNASGLRIGGAMTINENGNLLLNTGNATTRDILDLIEEIRKRVFKKFAVRLDLELKILT